MEMIDPRTAEESKPLLVLLERYAYFRTKTVAEQVLQELMNGHAVLYLMVDKVRGTPASMIGADGKPMTMWYATTTVDQDLIGATDHDEEITFQPHPVSEILRLMKKEGDKLPFLILRLNGDLDTEALLFRQDKMWRVTGPSDR